MAISLKKGGRIDLTKEFGLENALIGMGWDTNRYQGSADFDLDLTVFETDKNKRCLDEQHIIFYNSKQDPEGAIMHSGDNRTGAGDGDDETVTIDFAKINPRVENIIIVATIFEAPQRNQNFGLVDNSYIRVIDEKTGTELVRYDLGEDFSTQTAVVAAEIYKKDGNWRFRAVGEGYVKDLAELCAEYGLEAAYD